MIDKNLNVIISYRRSQNGQMHCERSRKSYAPFPQILCSRNLLESHFMMLLFYEPCLRNSFVIEQCIWKVVRMFPVPIHFKSVHLFFSWNSFPNCCRMMSGEEVTVAAPDAMP